MIVSRQLLGPLEFWPRAVHDNGSQKTTLPQKISLFLSYPRLETSHLGISEQMIRAASGLWERVIEINYAYRVTGWWAVSL